MRAGSCRGHIRQNHLGNLEYLTAMALWQGGMLHKPCAVSAKLPTEFPTLEGSGAKLCKTLMTDNSGVKPSWIRNFGRVHSLHGVKAHLHVDQSIEVARYLGAAHQL